MYPFAKGRNDECLGAGAASLPSLDAAPGACRLRPSAPGQLPAKDSTQIVADAADSETSGALNAWHCLAVATTPRPSLLTHGLSDSRLARE